MTAPSNIYPLATQDGRFIPLEVIRPSALLKLSLSSSIAGPVALSAEYKVGAFMSNVDSLVRFGSTVALPVSSGTIYTDLLFIPANTLTISTISASPIYYGTAGEATGILWIQLIEKWAGLGLEKQFVRK